MPSWSSIRWIITSSLSPTLSSFGSIASESSRKGRIAFGLAADVDEQFVLILRDDDAGEDLAFVENLQALFVHALLERELVFDVSILPPISSGESCLIIGADRGARLSATPYAFGVSPDRRARLRSGRLRLGPVIVTVTGTMLRCYESRYR